MSKCKTIYVSSDSEGDEVTLRNDGDKKVHYLSSDSEDSGSVTIIAECAAPLKKDNTVKQESSRYAMQALSASSFKQERHWKSYRCSSTSESFPKNVTKKNKWKKNQSPTSVAEDTKPSALPSKITLKAIEEASDEEKKDNDIFCVKLSNFLEQFDSAIVTYEQKEKQVQAATDYSRKLHACAEFFLTMYYPWKKLGHSGWGECTVFQKHVHQLARSVNGFGPQSVYLFAMIARDDFGEAHKFDFGLGRSTIYIAGFHSFRRDHYVN